MEYNDLTDEQKAKAKQCKTPEELIALAKSEGVELSDEQLDAIAGGSWKSHCTRDVANCTTFFCPKY